MSRLMYIANKNFSFDNKGKETTPPLPSKRSYTTVVQLDISGAKMIEFNCGTFWALPGHPISKEKNI